MVGNMEIPTCIRAELKDKGGLEGVTEQLADDSRIMGNVKIYSALSDPIRLKILDILNVQSLCVCLIKEIIDISDSKLSYHLSILKKNGLIDCTKQGNWIIYSVTDLARRYLIQ